MAPEGPLPLPPSRALCLQGDAGGFLTKAWLPLLEPVWMDSDRILRATQCVWASHAGAVRCCWGTVRVIPHGVGSHGADLRLERLPWRVRGEVGRGEAQILPDCWWPKQHNLRCQGLEARDPKPRGGRAVAPPSEAWGGLRCSLAVRASLPCLACVLTSFFCVLSSSHKDTRQWI